MFPCLAEYFINSVIVARPNYLGTNLLLDVHASCSYCRYMDALNYEYFVIRGHRQSGQREVVSLGCSPHHPLPLPVSFQERQ